MRLSVTVGRAAGILFKRGVKITSRIQTYGSSYIPGGQIGFYQHFAYLVKTLLCQIFRNRNALALFEYAPNIIRTSVNICGYRLNRQFRVFVIVIYIVDYISDYHIFLCIGLLGGYNIHYLHTPRLYKSCQIIN